jgi:MFS family permease
MTVDDTLERPTPRERQSIFDRRYRGLTAGILVLVTAVAFGSTAVSAVMPVAAHDLGGMGMYAWGFSGLMMASMFSAVVAGDACDRAGPVLPLVLGMVVYAAGLVVSAAAPSMVPFVVGRVIQGTGSGAASVALYVVIGRAYPDALRPRVFSAFSAGWMLPSVAGPLVAAEIAERVGWRYVFLGLVPFVLLPAALMWPRIRRLGAEAPGRARGRRRLVALAVAVGIGLLQFAGQRLDWRSSVPAALAGALLLVPGLARLLPAGTVRLGRGLPSVIVMRCVLTGAFVGANAYTPLMLTTHRGLTLTRAGLFLTVGSLGWQAGAWLQGRTEMSRVRIVQVGAFCVTTGLTAVALSTVTSVPVWLAGAGSIVAGFGMGGAMASLGVLMLDLSPAEEYGAVSTSTQISDSMGRVTFIAVGGMILAAHIAARTGTATFAAVYTVMIVLAAAGTCLAPRMRPADRPVESTGRL